MVNSKRFLSNEEIEKISMIINSRKQFCFNGHLFDKVSKDMNGKKIRICTICEKARRKKQNEKIKRKEEIEKNAKFQFFGVIKN